MITPAGNPCEDWVRERVRNGQWFIYTEPASRANQITYLYFCTLGGLTNPRLQKMERHNGTHIYFTYHLLSY